MQSSTTFPVKSPLEWNNHAVLLLEMGLTQEATTLFQKALQTLGATANHSSNNELTLLQDGKHNTPIRGVKAFTGWSSPLLLPTDNDSSAFVYNRALYIHPVFQNDLFELYSAAIIFNLGLVHHILALKGGDATLSSIDHYKQSYTLYEFAMKSITILQQNSSRCSCTSGSTFREQGMLKALLLNNSGHIFYTASTDSEEAFACFTAASALLTNTSIDASTLDDLDIGSLLRNVLLFAPCINAAASA